MQKYFFSFSSLFLMVLVGFAQQPCYEYKSQEYFENLKIEGLEEPEDALSFVVVGDWGRQGHFGQKEVADKMDDVMYKLDGEFVISTGDNFYPNGVESTEDPEWFFSFENIYTGHHLHQNWYSILGNHDYRGNVQAQIDYSKKSRRWQMPDRYFFKEYELEDDSNEKVLFVFIDTNPFERDYYQKFKYANIRTQDTTKQKQWLEGILAQSDARWKIVVGHHPMYTTGKRVDDQPYVRESLESILEKYNVDAYLAGHEHDIQHQKPENKKVHHFVSGAGSEVRKTGRKKYTIFADAVQGFLAMSVTKEAILIQAIDYQGKIIHKYTIKKTDN